MEERLLINGGKKLAGKVSVSGAKNAALAIIPATLLCKDVCVIENVPQLNDIDVLLEGMKELGAKVKKIGQGKVEIDCRNITSASATSDIISTIRGSYYMVGALLGRMKEAHVSFPGGCNFGARPIDQHIKGFEALGAQVDVEHGVINASADKLLGSDIYLDVQSVGATINIMMAAVFAEGVTVIENPAKEPHVVDTANFLNSMGAYVKGAGTDVIKIYGVKELHGSEYMVIPDQIEAGTYMVAGAITKGDITVCNLIPKHMEAVSAKLKEIGVGIDEGDDFIRVYHKGDYKTAHIKTLPYPGFPTDMQPQMTTLLTMIEGTSFLTDSIWETRFQYTDELNSMGANIKVEGNTAIITGIDRLSGAKVTATDLRAGAAMIIAGLAAQGETLIEHLDYIDRGYEHVEEKLRGLGADVYRVTDEPNKDNYKVV